MKEQIRLNNFFPFDNTPSTAVSKKVLIVDSNRIIAKQLGEIINSINHHSLGCVCNFDDLEKRIRLKEPDLIIINIATKGRLDGYQIAKLLKLDYEIPYCILCDDTNIRLKKWAEELNPDGIIDYSNNYIPMVAQLQKVLH